MIATGLYLMGQKGAQCLEKAIEMHRSNRIVLPFVVSARDASVKKDYFDEIRHLCQAAGIAFFVRSPDQRLPPADLSVAIGWRWLIHENADSLVVFHDSLLPKYRGFNPLVTALIEGDREIGVTAIRANMAFDSGDVIGQRKTPIDYPITIADAIDRVSVLYADLLEQVLADAAAGTLTETPQDESKASYSLWRDGGDYNIDWNQDCERIVRTIDALGFPYTGAVTDCDGKTIRIVKAESAGDLEIVNRTPGKVLLLENNVPTVVCASGLLRILEAQDIETGLAFTFTKMRIRLS